MCKPHKRFWMVWNPNGRRPVVKHETPQKAMAEAHRLASEHPWDRFYVLEAIGGFTTEVKVEGIGIESLEE